MLPHRCVCMLLLLAAAGCGDQMGRTAVSGEVRFGGEPLDYGTIDFRPVAGNSPVGSGGVIRDGAYRIVAAQGLPPGRYEVRIFSGTSNDPPPPAEAPGAAPPAVERIPPEFNVRTQQTVEVTAAGPNKFDFDIAAGP